MPGPSDTARPLTRPSGWDAPPAAAPVPADPALPDGELRARFDLGHWTEVLLLPGGKSQHHILTTSRGRFVLRRSYRAKPPDDVRFEHELVAHLRAGGFPAPEFVPTTDGEPYAVIDGRLWRTSVFVTGRPARTGSPEEAEVAAGALARYHDLVDGFTASVPTPVALPLPDALRERLSAVAAAARSHGRAEPPDLPFALAEAQRVADRLVERHEAMPVTTIHAGCRRGSTLFGPDTGELVAVLDFDSAHRDVRALDVAVAVHDFAKVYGDPSSPDYKVHLDGAVAARFVDAYHRLSPLRPEELEAVPLLLMAKRLKRALGRYARLLAGEPLSDNDHRKINLELARVRSLVERESPVPVTVVGGREG